MISIYLFIMFVVSFTCTGDLLHFRNWPSGEGLLANTCEQVKGFLEIVLQKCFTPVNSLTTFSMVLLCDPAISTGSTEVALRTTHTVLPNHQSSLPLSIVSLNFCGKGA